MHSEKLITLSIFFFITNQSGQAFWLNYLINKFSLAFFDASRPKSNRFQITASSIWIQLKSNIDRCVHCSFMFDFTIYRFDFYLNYLIKHNQMNRPSTFDQFKIDAPQTCIQNHLTTIITRSIVRSPSIYRLAKFRPSFQIFYWFFFVFIWFDFTSSIAIFIWFSIHNKSWLWDYCFFFLIVCIKSLFALIKLYFINKIEILFFFIWFSLARFFSLLLITSVLPRNLRLPETASMRHSHILSFSPFHVRLILFTFLSSSTNHAICFLIQIISLSSAL